MFEKLRIKFLSICVLLIGVILAAVFTVVFLSSSMGSKKNAERDMDAILASFSSDPPCDFFKNSMVVYINNGIYCTKYVNTDVYDTETVEKITDNVVADKRKFKVYDKTFLSKSGEVFIAEEGQFFRAYAVYDFTVEAGQQVRLGVTLIITYIGSMAVIAVVGWFLVGLAIKPVKAAFTMQKRLVADASHELKTPLTIISTTLSLFGRERESAKEKERLGVLDAQVNRMNGLIMEMLQLSALESSQIDFREEETNLSDIIVSALLSFDERSLEKNVEIRSGVAPDIVCLADSFNFEKLVNILMDNALKYCDENGRIEAKLELEKKTVLFSVENTGKGIGSEDLKHIFDRFYKSDRSREEQRNSFGLGLSIAQNIVRHMKGDIVCKSEIDKFTRFEVTFPYKKGPKSDTSNAETAEA